MPLNYPQRKSNIYTLVSCTLREGPDVLKGLRGISIEPTVEGRKAVFANGEIALGFTRGQKQFKGNVKLLLDSALDYARTQDSLLDTEHTFTVTLEEGARLDTITIQQALFNSFPIDVSGNEEIEVELGFDAILVLINGKPMAERGALAHLTSQQTG